MADPTGTSTASAAGAAAVGPLPAAAGAAAPAARATILVVDDTGNVRQILVHILERAGYQTVQATDGAEAVSLASMQRFDLILLDIMMPKMDGFSVCQELRRREKTRSLPIIMVTAKGDKESVFQAIRAGADDYVVKPFTGAVILDKIQQVLQRKGATR